MSPPVSELGDFFSSCTSCTGGETEEIFSANEMPFFGGESGLDFPDKLRWDLYEAAISSPNNDTNASAFDDRVGDELSGKKGIKCA